MLFPLAGGGIYLLLTRQLFLRENVEAAPSFRGNCDCSLLIALPWHVLATLRNPPYFDFTMHSVPGEYHGFLWFFFINEQFLRFLNLRYPRDYNTVPRLYFWLFHFAVAVSLERLLSRDRQVVVSCPSIAPERRACWRFAGWDLFWCSSPSPRRRSITRCPAIRRSPCCWDRR